MRGGSCRRRVNPPKVSSGAADAVQHAEKLPGEPFVEIGLAVTAASPFPVTAVVGYAEEYIGYIPTDRAFDNRGYETGPGRWSRCAAGAEAAMRGAAIELLRDLR